MFGEVICTCVGVFTLFILDVRLIDAPPEVTQDFSTFLLRCWPFFLSRDDTLMKRFGSFFLPIGSENKCRGWSRPKRQYSDLKVWKISWKFNHGLKRSYEISSVDL